MKSSFEYFAFVRFFIKTCYINLRNEAFNQFIIFNRYFFSKCHINVVNFVLILFIIVLGSSITSP